MLLEQLLLRRRVEHRTVLTNLLRCPRVSPVSLGVWAGAGQPRCAPGRCQPTRQEGVNAEPGIHLGGI